MRTCNRFLHDTLYAGLKASDFNYCCHQSGGFVRFIVEEVPVTAMVKLATSMTTWVPFGITAEKCFC